MMADGTRAPAADFERLLAEMRPRLHRYCARMVGSAFDGEDVVQDALAKAAEAWPTAGDVARPESWLFRIAHNTALDALRHRKRQAALSARLVPPPAEEGGDARIAAAASLATLMRLSPAQRSCVVLVDVLGHTMEETLAILDVTGPAAKAALHRGRLRLRELAQEVDGEAPALDPAMRQRLRDYADRFNARDFDALRALLAEDARLEVVTRAKFRGRKDVGAIYFTRYGEMHNWRFTAGLADGRPALLGSDPADPTGAFVWIILLDWADGEVTSIRDFHAARYIMETMTVTAV